MSQSSGVHTVLPRRSFLAASAAVGMASLTSQTIAATTAATMNRFVKIILAGGPSQIDLWDPKPLASSDVRSSFGTIATRTPGIQVSELLPQLASNIDQFTIARSICGSLGSHDLTQVTSGLPDGTVSDGSTVRARSFEEVNRLLHNGASDIELICSGWDQHRNLDQRLPCLAQTFDQDLCSFIQRLSSEGLLDSTTVLVWGEFSRSPRRNCLAGRDHWPAINSALIAGGRQRRGNVLGATSVDGSEIIDKPISMQQVFQSCDPRSSVAV